MVKFLILSEIFELIQIYHKKQPNSTYEYIFFVIELIYDDINN
jgi:hypothetical protein